MKTLRSLGWKTWSRPAKTVTEKSAGQKVWKITSPYNQTYYVIASDEMGALKQLLTSVESIGKRPWAPAAQGCEIQDVEKALAS